MSENREPKTCSNCQTVNAWMFENCRSCGESLSAPPEAEEPGPQGPQSPEPIAQGTPGSDAPGGEPRRSWMPLGGGSADRRMLAIIVGILLHTVVLRLGEVVISRLVLSPNPEVAAVVEELGEPRGIPLTDREKEEKLERIKDVMPTLVVSMFAFLLIAPLLTGLLVGAVFRNVLASVWAVGLATLLIAVMAGVAGATVQFFLVSLLISIVQSVLGGAGAILGIRIRVAHNQRAQ